MWIGNGSIFGNLATLVPANQNTLMERRRCKREDLEERRDQGGNCAEKEYPFYKI